MTAPTRSRIEAPVPPLRAEDRLTRDEFERRYDAMPDLKKAELLEGVVYMPSPVRAEQHGNPHADLIGSLVFYRANTPGVRVAADSTIRLDLDNEPQPDATMYIESAFGGQSHIDADGYLEGGPELVAEVAASNVRVALDAKLRVYRSHNIREYIVWRAEDRAIDWFVLRQGQYDRLALSTSGLFQSEHLPGLWLDPVALLAFDVARVFQVLQQGMASPEHVAFVAQMQQRAASQS